MPTEKKTMPVQYRTFAVERGEDAEQTRTIDLSFSSEEPYERYDGIEILGHNPSEVDLSRLNNSAPLLLNHDTDDQIGVVEFAKIEDGKGRARVRFGKSARAEEIFRDVLDGIRKNVSVAYRQLARQVEKVEQELETYRVTRWLPLEVSIVGIPADNTVGVGRSAELSDTNECEITKPDAAPEAEKATNEAEAASPVEAVAEPVEDAAKAEDIKPKITTGKEEKKMEQNDAIKIERARVAELTAIGQHCACAAEAATAIAEGTEPADFRKWVLENKFKAQPITDSPNIGMSEREIKQYSMWRAIKKMIDKKPIDGLEREVSEAVAKKAGRDARGFFVAEDVLQYRDVNTTTTTGGFTSQSTVSPNMIDMLSNSMEVVRAGATVMNGLQGNAALLIPRIDAYHTSYWVGDGTAPTEGDWTLSQISLTPKTVGAWTEVTRQIMLQTNTSIEQWVRRSLTESIALKVDLAALYGRASSSLTTEPLGILNDTTITRTAFGSTALGDVPTWSDLIGMQTTVGAANGFRGKLGYMSNFSIRGVLKTTPSSTAIAGAGFIANRVSGQDEIDGFPFYVTNQIPSDIALPSTTLGAVGSGLIFANWADLVVAFWSGLDILVDPYSQSPSGKTRICAFQDCDVAKNHPGSFVRVTDAKSATT